MFHGVYGVHRLQRDAVYYLLSTSSTYYDPRVMPFGRYPETSAAIQREVLETAEYK